MMKTKFWIPALLAATFSAGALAHGGDRDHDWRDNRWDQRREQRHDGWGHDHRHDHWRYDQRRAYAYGYGYPPPPRQYEQPVVRVPLPPPPHEVLRDILRGR